MIYRHQPFGVQRREKIQKEPESGFRVSAIAIKTFNNRENTP